MGAGLLAADLLEGVDCAFSVDGAKPVGTVITRALGQTSFAFVIHGRAAHAAANPEAGINAIAVACRDRRRAPARPPAGRWQRQRRRDRRRLGHRPAHARGPR